MKIRFTGRRACSVIPALAGAMIMTDTAAVGQIQPDGYTCSATYSLTHNNSLDITARSLTCNLPTSMVHWYDLAAEPELACHYTALRCVDFSLWSSSNLYDQEIFIRVFEDRTPASRGSTCPDQGYGSVDEPGPGPGGLLLWEGATVFPSSSDGVSSTTTPRPDGDRSIRVGEDIDGDGQPDGVLLPPDSTFFVEVGHRGEATTRFGGNRQGEVGDADDGPEVTWVRAPDCGGGGCTAPCSGVNCQSTDFAKLTEWTPLDTYDRDLVMQVHLDRDPLALYPLLPFCPEDTDRDLAIDIDDLLAVLATWGRRAGCEVSGRPTGDIAPPVAGDFAVDITDLLAVLAAWGPCPNPNADCVAVTQLQNESVRIGNGSHPFVIDGLLDGPPRPPTNDYNDILSGPTECGWFDYGENGIPGGFRWGDAFGVDAALEITGGDAWFLYTAPCQGPVEIFTDSGCGPGELTDTVIEVYEIPDCPESWLDLIACGDAPATGACGDHAFVEIDAAHRYSKYLIRVGGKFGEQGSADLTIRPRQFGTPDCNGNGLLDTWDICEGGSGDCNENRIPDECEPDCNGNGLADSCDLYQNDCNLNGVPDECDPDCDGNGVPDECQSIHLIDSGPLALFGAGSPQSFLVVDPPEAIGDVTFSFFASADLADALKSVDLFIDGYYITTVFADAGGACSVPGDREDFTYRRAFFNLIYALDGDTNAQIDLVPTADVDVAACPAGSFIQLSLKFAIEATPENNGATQDCNGNGVWDVCDVAPGGASADVNGNGVPDECEL